MRIKLEPGKKYFNSYNGKEFKVLNVKEKSNIIKFQYDGSDVCEGDLKQKVDLIEKIIIDKRDGYEKNLFACEAIKKERMKRNQEKFLKEIKFNDIPKSKLYFTLGFLSKNCFLELRTVPDTDSRDCNRYMSVVGKHPSEELEGYEFDAHPKTWSTKIYLRFKDVDIEAVKYLYFPDNIEGKSLLPKDDGFYYYSVEWCWILIEKYGFRLGRNHDIELLRSVVPPRYLSDFEEGLNR